MIVAMSPVAQWVSVLVVAALAHCPSLALAFDGQVHIQFRSFIKDSGVGGPEAMNRPGFAGGSKP